MFSVGAQNGLPEELLEFWHRECFQLVRKQDIVSVQAHWKLVLYCRLFGALCKARGAKWRIQVFCMDSLEVGSVTGPLAVSSIAAVWPASIAKETEEVSAVNGFPPCELLAVVLALRLRETPRVVSGETHWTCDEAIFLGSVTDHTLFAIYSGKFRKNLISFPCWDGNRLKS